MLSKCFFKLLIVIIVLPILGCQKYLDSKPDKKLVAISSLQDLQSLLDAYFLTNNVDPGSPEASADNYYLTPDDFFAREEWERNLYTWNANNVFPRYGFDGNDWSRCYDNIYKANTVLENISNVERNFNNQIQWDNVKGQALLLRGKSFLQAAFVWCLIFDPGTSATDLGLPLRLNSNFNEPSIRSNLQQTYDQIIYDLKESSELLSGSSEHPVRLSKPAAYALLARVYLSMRMYDSCMKYSGLCLQLKNNLMDYNGGAGVNLSGTFPLMQFNPEVILDSRPIVPGLLARTRAKIDSTLYASYLPDDLRKIRFFRSNGNGTYQFRGSYTGSAVAFDGIATNEVYLMRAECNARLNKVTEAMNDLNTLMINRWVSGTFVPFSANDGNDALNKILAERRKELLMRQLRWMDIKRLNKEGAQITLKRIIGNQTYILAPNDLKYALPIPEDVIELSGMQQNPR